MRHVVFILAMVMVCTSAALAQENVAPEGSAAENPAYARLMATPYFSLAPSSGAAVTTPVPAAPALGLTPAALSPGASPASPSLFSPGANASPSSPAPDPQGVQGVFVNYNWQAYFGYTFTRVYEHSHATLDTNGFNYSIVYYFDKFSWFGLDGEMAATRDSQFGADGWFLFGGGGPRFRWSGPRGIELWGHTLFGWSHLSPRTSYGSQNAWAFTVGGGADIDILRSRWALRLGADMVATNYFNTYQYSPKAFGGVVFKF